MSIYGAVKSGLAPVDAFGGAKSMYAAKGSFFDSDLVIRTMDKAARKALSKFGAFVRTASRSSLRYTKGPASSGNSPHVHETSFTTGKSPLKDFLYFSWDAETKSVVIGPAKTNQRNAWSETTIPEVLEYGGLTSVHEHLHKFASGKEVWVRTDLRMRLSGQHFRSAVGKQRRVRTFRIPQFPYMAPAFAQELPKLPSFFEGSFGKGAFGY